MPERRVLPGHREGGASRLRSIHYGDWRAALTEAARVGRTVWVRTFAPSYLRSSFLSRWFPSAAVREGFIGTLHLLEPKEVEAGLWAFRQAHPDPGETISYPLPFVWVAGHRS